MRTLIDTNLIIRFLLGPDEPGFTEAETEIKAGCGTLPETIPEVIYVMSDVYGADRGKIADALLALLEDVEVERDGIIKAALRQYGHGTPKLDYVDCLYLAVAEMTGCRVSTLDEKLKRQLKKLKSAKETAI